MNEADRHFLMSKRNGFDTSVQRGFLHRAINERGSQERLRKGNQPVEERLYAFHANPDTEAEFYKHLAIAVETSMDCRFFDDNTEIEIPE